MMSPGLFQTLQTAFGQAFTTVSTVIFMAALLDVAVTNWSNAGAANRQRRMRIPPPRHSKNGASPHFLAKGARPLLLAALQPFPIRRQRNVGQGLQLPGPTPWENNMYTGRYILMPRTGLRAGDSARNALRSVSNQARLQPFGLEASFLALGNARLAVLDSTAE